MQPRRRGAGRQRIHHVAEVLGNPRLLQVAKEHVEEEVQEQRGQESALWRPFTGLPCLEGPSVVAATFAQIRLNLEGGGVSEIRTTLGVCSPGCSYLRNLLQGSQSL